MGLKERIRRQISLDGPLTIANYMAMCLTDPKEGYYTTGQPIGSDGDFTTAPEISQMFGELIGVWCVSMWRNIGSPKRFNLVELGPGRGTLMADLLRATSVDAGFMDGVQIRLLDISDKLRVEQASALADLGDKVAWIDRLDANDALPTLFIGNEFLDALPLRQYVKTGDLWRERMVGLRNGELTFMAGAGVCDPAKLPVDHQAQMKGTIFETAPAREAVVVEIASHIKRFGGMALLIDYGHLGAGFGDTFQAILAHKFSNPLHNPGRCDLTSHVDFAALDQAVADDVQTASCMQGEFLLAMGLLERAGALGRNKPQKKQEELRSSVERLAGSDQMGDLFKVMIIAPEGVNPAGVER